MKKFIQYLGIALLSITLTNCDTEFLNLTDPDAFDVTKFYKTEQDMNDALTASYSATRTFYNYMYYVTEMKSDNTNTTNTGDSGGLYSTFTTHNVSSNNAIVGYVWNGLYNCIYKSNLVLSHVDNVTMSDSSRVSIKAQAKFLRALSHFYLIRLFGEVPVCDKLVETTAEAKLAHRQPINDAYALIVQDLKSVAEAKELPTFINGSSPNFGRITRTAGAALLGKVYLTMAATIVGQDTCYNAAIRYLNLACELKGFTDFPASLTFPKVFGTANEGNDEIIFQCMYLANTTEFSTFAYDFQPYGQTGLTSAKVGRGCNLGEKNLYNEYEKNDRRLGATMLATADGNYYYSKKYVDLTSPLGYGGNNWIELRFADVFLMLSEAYERVNQLDLAKSYLDKVRVRASLPKYDIASAEYHTAYPTLRDAIFHERRMELAFENQRWFDLQRQYPIKTNLVAHMQSFDGPKYKLFKEYELLLPIPYEEVQINPVNFIQNPGY